MFSAGDMFSLQTGLDTEQNTNYCTDDQLKEGPLYHQCPKPHETGYTPQLPGLPAIPRAYDSPFD
jgi:hypothetical protein